MNLWMRMHVDEGVLCFEWIGVTPEEVRPVADAALAEFVALHEPLLLMQSVDRRRFAEIAAQVQAALNAALYLEWLDLRAEPHRVEVVPEWLEPRTAVVKVDARTGRPL